MATAKKTEPQPSTFVKFDAKGKKVDTQKASNPALRNELLTSGYSEEKPKAVGSAEVQVKPTGSAGSGK